MVFQSALSQLEAVLTGMYFVHTAANADWRVLYTHGAEQ